MPQTNEQHLKVFRSIVGSDYDRLVPSTTRANITDIGNAMVENKELKEKFFNEYLIKITSQLVRSLSFKNKFAFLKSLRYVGTIEESFVESQNGEDFEDGDENPFTQKKGVVKVIYHSVDRKLRYQITVTDDQLLGAFLTENGIDSLINECVNALLTKVETTEFTMVKELFNGLANREADVGGVTSDPIMIKVDGATITEQANDLLYKMLKYSKVIQYPSTAYNVVNVEQATSLINQLFVVQMDYMLAISYTKMANAFNMSELKVQAQVIETDNFNANEKKVVAVLTDRTGFRIGDQLKKTTSIYNPKKLYTNLYHHTWSAYSFSLFTNMIFFYVEDDLSDETPSSVDLTDSIETPTE